MTTSQVSPPPIQGLWVRGALPPMQLLSIRSFLANGHPYDLYSYDEVINLPAGARLLPATDILPEEEIFAMRGEGGFKGSVAPFADLFRYKLLHERGGWWVDLDFVCLRPFDFASPWVFASERNPDGSRKKAISVIKAPPGNDVMAECYERGRAHANRDKVWGAVGADLLHPAIARRGLAHFTQAPEVFCPIHWWQAESLFQPGEIPDAHAVHLWNSMWRQAGWPQDPARSPGTLYHRLHERYPEAP